MAMATLTNAKDFPAGSDGDDASHWTKWSAMTGGDLKWSAALSPDPAALTANQFYRIPAGGLVQRVPIGTQGATESCAADGLHAVLDEGEYYQLHDGDPGSAGTSNILTTRIRIQRSEFTLADG